LLSPEAADHLLGHAILEDTTLPPDANQPSTDDLDDAIEERKFLDRAAVEPHERGRLEDAMDRIERHMDDRVMIWGQRRAELVERIAKAQARRDAAVGASGRDRAEAELRGLEQEREAANAEISRLRARDDEDYDTWRLAALERRYNVPRAARILDVEFLIT
ncbi:MAG: hypothetical protein K0V04_23640, partial [Deltaproteobacteria bacterium]|nr:hypothetical protein [Deltaproteobacteria bacterium]